MAAIQMAESARTGPDGSWSQGNPSGVSKSRCPCRRRRLTVATAAPPPLFAQCEAIGADYHHDPLPRLGPAAAFDIEFGLRNGTHLQNAFLVRVSAPP